MENEISHLRKENALLKSELANLNVLKLDQHEKIDELQKNLASFETSVLKSSSTVKSFEDNYRLLEVQNKELESTIRFVLYQFNLKRILVVGNDGFHIIDQVF